MSRKIVAIGGWENWRIKEWIRLPYETGPMDEEIIRLTGKEHPNFLLLAHAQPIENQERYFNTMKDIYGWKYGCDCKDLKSDKLTDAEYVQNLVDWADIIYEGWWNTLNMIELWRNAWFDKILRKAWESGKVMCWLSAWANCWFKRCSSDSLKILKWSDQPFIWMYCLWFVEWLFVPHADEPGRQERIKELLENDEKEVLLLISNCAALEIIDDEYRVLTTKTSKEMNRTINKWFWKRIYRKNEKYTEESLDDSWKFKPLSELYSKI